MATVEKVKQAFNWQITFGNLLTIAVFVIGGLAGYVRLEAKVTQMAIDLSEHKNIQQTEMAHYVRKDVQETRNGFIDDKLRTVGATLDSHTALLNKILQEIRFR